MSTSLVGAAPTSSMIRVDGPGGAAAILAPGCASPARGGSTLRSAAVVSGASVGGGENGGNAFVGCDRGIVVITLTLPSSWRSVAVPSIMTAAEQYHYTFFWYSKRMRKVTSWM